MLTQDNYVKAMRAYFTMYGATLATNPDYFWGPKAVTKMSYFSQNVGAAGTPCGFFMRMLGISFLCVVLGSVRYGVSDRAFTKQATTWHVLTTKIFYDCAKVVGTKRAPSPFVSSTWQLQVLINIALAAWGIKAAGGVQKLIKAD